MGCSLTLSQLFSIRCAGGIASVTKQRVVSPDAHISSDEVAVIPLK